MSNTSIVVCGQKYDIGTRVVLWDEPKGFCAYDTEAYETEDRKTGKVSVVKGKRYRSRLALGGTPDFEKLKTIAIQLTFHHSGLYRSKDTFETLQQRGLSVHYICDDNGILYQTLDVRERAYHVGLMNFLSIGIEIDSRAVAGKYPDAYDETHQKKYGVGPRKVKFDTIHGMKMKGFDYSDAQYATLIKLARVIVKIFPLIKPDFPRDENGQIIKTQIDNLKQYHGFITHYQNTVKKIDAICFDFDRFLLGVNGTEIIQPQETAPEPIPTQEPIDLSSWSGRQTALKQLGYHTGVIDGIFGSNTKAALQAFQKDNGLSVDGIWEPITEAKIQELLE